MIEMTDQTGFTFSLQQPARSIVSLVPSITELLSDLQLDHEVKGITLYCVHPEHWKHSKMRIGGTKKIKHNLIESLNPDLILANKEENLKEDVEKLREKFPVYTSEVKTLDNALEMISHIGLLTGKTNQSKELTQSIKAAFQKLNESIAKKQKVKALYLIWKNPFMSVGDDTFIHHLMERAGLINVAGNYNRYPEISEEEIKNSGAELVLLSSEPFPFREKHAAEIQKIMPSAKVMLADGTYFSWYGSRLKNAPGYLLELRKQIDTIHTFEAQS